MNPWLLGAGIALILLVVVDVLWTTLFLQGAGPLTARVSRTLAALAVRLPSRVRRPLMPTLGSLCLLVAIGAWVLLMWLGWWLLFSAWDPAVIHGQTRMAADAWARAYFSGFTVFTLGVGDYVPQGGGWQLATALSSFSGLFLITLAITYLLPVLSAATEKRQLATLIHDLGGSPTAIIVQNWDGSGFGSLTQRLSGTIWPQLHLHAQRHLTYPVLHYFHSRRPETALELQVAALDDALTILESAVAKEARPGRRELAPIRNAVASLLEEARGRSGEMAAGDPPPVPDLQPLREAGIPLLAKADFSCHRDRRRALLALVQNSGWQWTAVLDENPGRPAGAPVPTPLR